MSQPQDNPAAAYERIIVKNIFEPWSDDLIHRVAPQAGERVLDVACGTGILMRKITSTIGPTGSIVGLDISTPMLDIARGLVASAGTPVEFVQGSGTEMPLKNATFDVVMCEQGLQFFPDQAAGLREMRRVLVKGGRVAVSCWLGFDRQPFMRVIDGVVSKHLAPGAFSTPFSLGDAALLAQLAEESGFSNANVVEHDIDIVVSDDPSGFVSMLLLGAAAVIPVFGELSPSERADVTAAMRQDLDQATAPFITDGVLRFGTASNVLTAVA